MEKGTVCFCLNVINWNNFEDGLILEIPSNDLRVRLYKRSSRIECHILEADILRAEYLSQLICFTNNSGDAFFAIPWDETEINFIMLNGLLVDKSSNKEILECSFEQTEENVNVIYNRTDIFLKCNNWISWRNLYFSQPQLTTSNGKVTKSLDEQFIEFDLSIKELTHLYHEVYSKNNDYFLSSIYAKLRTMLFWPDDIRKIQIYKPLLIRLAGFLKLPLPVYAIPKKLFDKKFYDYPEADKMSILLHYNHASVEKKTDFQDVVDIQEWLESVLIDKDGTIEYRIKDFVFDLSNIFGAHNDEAIPKKLKTLKTIIMRNTDGIKSAIENITLITIQTASYVLSEYKNMKHRI